MGKLARDELPVSDSHALDQEPEHAAMKRLLSISEGMTRSFPSSSAAANFRRSASLPADYQRRRRSWSLRHWWDTCRAWISNMVHGTERREKETIKLGGGQSQSLSSWKRIVNRLRSGLTGNGGGAGNGFRYDSFSYAQNFDDGVHDDED